MSKKKGKTPQPAVKTMTASAPKMEAFTFGEPVPVLDRRDILDYVECISNGRWYEPPVSFTGLAKSLRAAVHHSSPIYVKRNILASTFIPHPWLHDLKLIVDRSYQLQAAFLYRSSDEPLLSIFLLVLRTPDKESHQS